MKKILLICLLLTGTLLAFAQNSGRGFSYQAVARNKDGAVKAAENVKIQFSLLPGDFGAPPAWQETQVATTDEFGVFTMTIGKGIKSGGTVATFKEVNFAAAEVWLKVEIEDNAAWQEISKTQLLSVPYAEVAGNASPTPTGFMAIFAGPKDKVPAGWLLCDGTELSRTDYAPLYGVIGTAWGHGNGSTTFRVPDMRGVFPRGVSDGRHDDNYTNRPAMYPGGNTNNNVGSFQGEEFRSHNHGGNTTLSGAHKHTSIKNGATSVGWEKSNQGGNDSGWSSDVVDSAHPLGVGGYLEAGSDGSTHTHGIVASGGSETRPDNVYVNFIIKL